jgi:hypothetical protein
MAAPFLVAPNGFHNHASTYTVQPASPPNINPNLGMVYLDNYLTAVGTLNTSVNGPYNVLYTSAYNGDLYAWTDNTNYTLAEIFPNGIEWIDKHHNNLVVFTSNSLEFFYDAGNGLGSPFARQTIYAKEIGIMPFKVQNTVAKDKDNIYFIGKNQNNYMDVYVISNFMCKGVGSHYIRETLNYYANSTSGQIAGIETVNFDTHTMIMITFTTGNLALMYFPEEDVWWTINTTDLNASGNIRSNFTLASIPASKAQRPYAVEGNQASSVINFLSTDLEGLVSNTGSYYTEVLDMDTSYWKHIAKVMAVGDYGNRNLTLWYSNDPTYTTFVQTTTKSPLNDGYKNSVWWDNVTRFRRGSLRIDMTGAGPCHHRGFDIMYNMGSN